MTVTPGYQLAAGEKATKDKLNALGKPAVTLDDGEITEAKLALNTQNKLASLRGKNLLCNGTFQLWENPTVPTPDYGGLQPSPQTHEYGSAKRWVVANEAAQTIRRIAFLSGSIEVPENPTDFLRWGQTIPLTRNPGYLGQRMEDVRRFSGQTLTFSVYIRITPATTILPALRQWFGNPNPLRTIAGSIGVIAAGTGNPSNITDGNNGFKLLDVGSPITISGPGFTTLSTTIIAYGNSAFVQVAASLVGGPWAGLTAVITNVAPASPEVVVAGTPVALPDSAWTRLVQTFAVPSVAGKTVPDINKSFTEVRVQLPQGQTFQADFTNAQLEAGSVASPVESRLYQDDVLYSMRYRERFGVALSANIAAWHPSWMLFPKLYVPVLTLLPVSGTGATVASDGSQPKEFLSQITNHSAVVAATVIADSELRD